MTSSRIYTSACRESSVTTAYTLLSAIPLDPVNGVLQPKSLNQWHDIDTYCSSQINI